MSLDHCEYLFDRVRRAQSLPEVICALEPLFKLYQLVNLGLERSAVFWRARLCGANPWPNISDMGGPPADLAQIGRLHHPSTPLLYASIKEETALREVGSTTGTTVQIIGYRAMPGQYMRLAVIGELMHVHKLGYMRLMGRDPDFTIARLLNDLELARARQVLYIDAFLHSLLSDIEARANGYMFTRAIAAIVHRDPETDGIAFPSACDPLGYNITLRGSAVGTKVHATACIQCRVDAIRDFGFVDYTVVQDAVRLDSHGNFEWVPPSGPMHRRFFNLTREEYEIALKHKDDPNAFTTMTGAHQ